MIKNRNVKVCINDTDKNLGPINADKTDAIKECHRQLYDIFMCNKISWEEAKPFIEKIKINLKNIVRKHLLKGSCSNFEAKLILSKIDYFSLANFYIIWKILKNPHVGRPIVAGYNSILTPAPFLLDSS